MSTLVVYHSSFGEGHKIGEAVARAAGAESEVIRDAESGGGAMGYRSNILSGRHEPDQIGAMRHNPADYDLIAIGTPAEGNHLPEAVVSFLELYRDRIRDVAFFAVPDGHDAQPLLRQLRELAGKEPVAEAVLASDRAHPEDEPDFRRFAEELRRH